MRWDVYMRGGTDVSAGPRVIEVVLGAQGVRGPRGVEGGAFTATAAEALSGHRVVKSAPDGIRYADLAEPDDGPRICGVTLGAAAQGDGVEVRYAGVIDEPTWSWTPGPVFCGALGQLTQSPPAGAFVRHIATALSPTRILVEPSPTVLTP